MDNGWIKIWRKSIGSSVWYDPLVWMFWCWCLMKANHDKKTIPFNGQDIEIKPGSFVTGYNKACEEVPTLTRQKYRSILDYLKSTSRITIKTTNKYTVITINKWKEYQELTNKITNQQPTNNQPITTNKNDENDKRIISKDIITGEIVIKENSHPFSGNDIDYLIEYMKSAFDIPALDETVQANRRYCRLAMTKFGGKDGIQKLIDLAATSDFWSNKVTSFKDIYYKGIKIINSHRGTKSSVTQL